MSNRRGVSAPIDTMSYCNLSGGWVTLWRLFTGAACIRVEEGYQKPTEIANRRPRSLLAPGGTDTPRPP
ncbi:hypothetical protein BQ8482_360016 [Mesorhizobium delmotii]|uniref:Uncharacterized protein n=1 Tax=Mesorhizobium delmotii TaxID=1631247 RepID=A0A2P9AR37_9HYPH|nr:hypothetical protein BQ8482_360016 [Mesorhizobium delmotii]